MPLSPIDIQQKTFGIALRGYDLDEVDDFLDEIVTGVKDYETRLRDAEERISALERELADRSNAENAISRALLAAQQSADTLVEDAKAEAEQIMKSAETESQQILRSAEVEAEQLSAVQSEERMRIRSEIDQMRAVVHGLRAQARALAASVDSDAAALEAAADSAEAEIDSIGVETPTEYRPVAAFDMSTAPGDTPSEPRPFAAGVTVEAEPEPEPAAAFVEMESIGEPAQLSEELFESTSDPTVEPDPGWEQPDRDLDWGKEEIAEQSQEWAQSLDDRGDEDDRGEASGDGQYEDEEIPAPHPERMHHDQVADLPVIGEEPRPWLSDAIDIAEEGAEEWSGWSRTTKTDDREGSTVTRPWEEG